MIGQFPLWMILAMWLLQRRARSKTTIYGYYRQLRLIEDMRGCLPLPRNRAEVWMMAGILTWLDRERDSLRTLRMMGVLATVEVRNN